MENHEEISKVAATQFEPTQCNKCGRQFSTAGDLSKHLCTGSKFKPTKCLKCGKILINKKQMMTHECPAEEEEGEDVRGGGQAEQEFNSTKCSVCGKEFPKSVRRTIIHEVEECGHLARRSHPDFKLKIFTCEQCVRHFVIKRKFKLHMERHREENGEMLEVGEIIENKDNEGVDDESQDTENIDPQPPASLADLSEEDRLATDNFFKVGMLKEI